MQKLKIGLVSHLVRDYNLGCVALAISNIKIMDEVFDKNHIEVEYIVILAEPKDNIDLNIYTSLEGYTSNRFTYRTYPRLKPILKNPFLLSKTTAFENCDFIVDLCGGDGYTDNYGLIRLLAESVIVYGARKKDVPVVFAPQTIGPFNTIVGKIFASHTLKKLEYIFVRDLASNKCCERLGLNNITTQVIDVAFALPYTKVERNNSKIKIGINVSGLLFNGGYNRNNYFGLSFSYKDFVYMLLEKLSSELNIEVHLIAHVISDRDEMEDDYRVCEDLAKRYPSYILAPKFDSPIDAKSYIAGMDLFSGARMHSTIAATSSGVPVVPVAYSRKFNGLYDTLQYPYYIDAKAKINSSEAVEMFFTYMNKLDELKKGILTAEKIYKKELEKYKNDLTKVFKL